MDKDNLLDALDNSRINLMCSCIPVERSYMFVVKMFYHDLDHCSLGLMCPMCAKIKYIISGELKNV
jgi:hypothetical protein